MKTLTYLTAVGLIVWNFLPISSLAGEEAFTTHTSQVLPAQFQLTVYDLNPKPEHVRELDGKTLATRAATAEALLSALTQLGEARILYRIDQPVDLASAQIQVGSSEPLVTGVRTSGSGQPIKTVTYHNLGLIVRLSSDPAEARQTNAVVKLSIQLSLPVPSKTELAPGVPATTTRTMSIQHSEVLVFEKPLVAVSVYSPDSDSQAVPKAYLVRYVFRPPAKD